MEAISSAIDRRTRSQTTLRHLWAAPLALGLVLTSLTGSAAAQVDDGPTSTTIVDDDLNARHERACLRIPNLTVRAEKLLERIADDASTPGSLEWLDARVTQAETAGRIERAELLRSRRAVRAQTVVVLEQRLSRLDELSERCAAAGVEQ